LLLDLKKKYNCNDIQCEDEMLKIFYHDFNDNFKNVDPQLKKDIENLCIQILKGHVAKSIVVQYHDWLISTNNPINKNLFENNLHEVWCRPEQHPCSQKFSDLHPSNYHDDYVNTSNSVQRHTKCRPSYCQKQRTVKSKEFPEGKIERFCKFGFDEFKYELESKLIFEDHELRDGSIKWIPKIVSKRNDQLMNRHNRWILQVWRANQDRQLLLDENDTIRYTCKYSTKQADSSAQLLRSLEKMTDYIEDTDSVSKTVTKILNKVIGVRDMGKNEVCWAGVQGKNYSCSYSVKKVNLYDNTNGTIDFHNEYKNVYGRSFIQLYEERSQKYTNMNLDTYARCVKVTSTSNGIKEEEISKKEQEKTALMFQPRYPSSRSSKIYWKYCKYNLIRYKTFTNLNELFDENTTEEQYIQKWKSFLKENPNVISNWEKN